MIARPTFLLAVLFALACGCKKLPPHVGNDTTTVPVPSEKSTLPARYEAAMQIVSNESRDAALRQVAIESAQTRNPDMAKRAVNAIVTLSVREAAAEQAALRFAKAGLIRDATALANQIGSIEVRDRTFSAIAKGSPASPPPAANSDQRP